MPVYIHGVIIYEHNKSRIETSAEKSRGFIFKCIKETPNDFFILINDNRLELKIDLMESGVVYYRGTPKKYFRDKYNCENGFYEVLNSSLLLLIGEGSFGMIQSNELKHIMIMTDNYQIELVVYEIEDIMEQL